MYNVAGNLGLKEEIKTQIKGIFLIALAVFCYSGLVMTEQTGYLGEFVNNTLRTVAGETAVVIPFMLGIFALRAMLPHKILNIKSRLAGVAILLALFTVNAHFQFMLSAIQEKELLMTDLLKANWEIAMMHQGGGLLGALIFTILFFLFRDVGSYIVLSTLALVSLLLITNVSITQILTHVRAAFFFLFRILRSFFSFLKDTYNILITGEEEETVRGKKRSDETEDDEVIIEPPREIPGQEEGLFTLPIEKELSLYQAERNPAHFTSDELDGEEEAGGVHLFTTEQYVLPSINLLTRPNRPDEHTQTRYIKDRARLLENTLNSFGVKARVVNVQSGPTVTRFEVQPEVGVKVSKILNLSDDLALNLAAASVRIEAPIPGKAALGIEVPNKVISLVYLKEVLEDAAFQTSPSVLTIALGKDITGVPVVTSLEHMPHLLIAGATGSGKSVCLNTLLVSLLYKAMPDQVRFLMIDPKMVELSIYNGIPHLIAPVVTDPKRASLALKNMVREMTKRYDTFAHEGVRDISAYNDRISRGILKERKLPYIVVIIDELADLMLIAPAEVEDSIARLAQMSRAAGIHLVVATQRPSVDVLTGIIKANITSRISFTVSSQVDSRTILDMAGAEKLLGRGDMLFYPVGAVKPLRIQGAYIGEKDLNTLTDFVKQQGRIDYHDDLVGSNQEDEEDWDQVDLLFPDAVELVVRTGQASISLLQRRFRIGYTRAARLIDDLERKGVVGSHEGSKPREIIITPEQASRLYEEYKQRLS